MNSPDTVRLIGISQARRIARTEPPDTAGLPAQAVGCLLQAALPGAGRAHGGDRNWKQLVA